MKYGNVMVYCSGEKCRNNLGKWKVTNVTVPSNLNGNKFYFVKDESMAKAADYGFMLWDGKSPGTLNNIFNMLFDRKKVLLYYSPETQFYTIIKLYDIEQLLAKCEPYDILRFEKKIKLSNLQKKLRSPEQISIRL